MAGRYETAGKEAIKRGEIEFSGNYETVGISLKVLDAIAENSEELSVKYALIVLEDAKKILLQMIGI